MPVDKWTVLKRLRFHYRDWGGIGRPIVLLHGLASTCRIWDLVAPILAHDFAVFALDHRGHGESDKPDHGYEFASIADDLHAFIGRLDVESPVIVGHSWGGNVAVQYAATYPTVPSGLCLVDGGTIEVSASPDMTLERARSDMAPPDFSDKTIDELRAMAKSRDFGFELTPQVLEAMSANFRVLADRTVRPNLSRENHMKIIDEMWAHKPSALYESVQAPVLMMPARGKDWQFGEEWDRRKLDGIEVASQRLPASKTVWLEDSVHDVPLQRPELVAKTIREHILNGFFGPP